MSLLKQVIKEYGMDPKDFGIQGLASTVKKIENGEDYEMGFTTYLQQREQAEEEEVGEDPSANAEFSESPRVEQILELMYSDEDNPYQHLYKATTDGHLSLEEFCEVLTYYTPRDENGKGM